MRAVDDMMALLVSSTIAVADTAVAPAHVVGEREASELDIAVDAGFDTGTMAVWKLAWWASSRGSGLVRGSFAGGSGLGIAELQAALE